MTTKHTPGFIGKRDPFDTGVLPSGGLVDGGGPAPNRGQAGGGYGASRADLKRGHTKPGEPEKHENPHPQRGSIFEEKPKGGFLSRDGFSTER